MVGRPWSRCRPDRFGLAAHNRRDPPGQEAPGEEPAYPVALHSAYKWFPNELRTLPTAIIAQGAGFGIMLALPLLNWVIVHYSWHWAFGALGIAGLAWTAAWLVLGREGASPCENIVRLRSWRIPPGVKLA